MSVQTQDTWKFDGAEWAVVGIDEANGVCRLSGPGPCRGMKTVALAHLESEGELVARGKYRIERKRLPWE